MGEHKNQNNKTMTQTNSDRKRMKRTIGEMTSEWGEPA